MSNLGFGARLSKKISVNLECKEWFPFIVRSWKKNQEPSSSGVWWPCYTVCHSPLTKLSLSEDLSTTKRIFLEPRVYMCQLRALGIFARWFYHSRIQNYWKKAVTHHQAGLPHTFFLFSLVKKTHNSYLIFLFWSLWT